MTKTASLPGVDVVKDYLRQRFDRVDVHEAASNSVVFDVAEQDCRWRITFPEEFIVEQEAGAIRQRLEDWNLAGEMRRAEGFGLSVSSAGIRLESSN